MTEAPILEALEATWPAARVFREGPWLIREGRGGGQRVSAATAAGPCQPGDIALAEAAMRGLGQDALFMLTPEDGPLDRLLEARGYAVHDPVVICAGDIHALSGPAADPMSGFPHWPPLAIAARIWAEGGIGPARLAVMDRVPGPKAAILGRSGDEPAGVAFAAVHRKVACVHAVEVATPHRRRGLGRQLMAHAALWAAEQGATQLALAVTRANLGARALYEGLGMDVAGHYHYRKPMARPAPD